jgi:2-polyprenyl-3-methyl-5-hydroxy-6-metoxy-1,4-benzoquinol methylase
MTLEDAPETKVTRRIHDESAPLMEWNANFYQWILDIDRSIRISTTDQVLDVGCGTGRLLQHLDQQRFRSLTGINFSPRCLELARINAPSATLLELDIETQEIPGRYQHG